MKNERKMNPHKSTKRGWLRPVCQSMSTLKKPERETVERPRDELEGALLPPGPAPAPIPMNDPLRQPPSAVAVPISSTDVASAAAATSSTTAAAAASLAATIADIPTVAAVPVVAAVPFDNCQYSSYPSQDAEEKEKLEKEKDSNRGTFGEAAAAAGDASDTVASAPYFPAYDEGFEQGNRDYAESAEMYHANLNGKKSANEEMTDIHRAKQKISAKTYNEREAIREANEEAKRRNRSGVQIKEDKWFKYEDTKPAEGDADNDTYLKKKGGGYEVNEYEVSEYETKEYETTEYKSVYDD